jgi:hypothetical protein
MDKPFARRQIRQMFWHDRMKFMAKVEDAREEGIDLMEEFDETLAERKFEMMREERSR